MSVREAGSSEFRLSRVSFHAADEVHGEVHNRAIRIARSEYSLAGLNIMYEAA
jgi:hypothetical protein